MVKRYKPRVSDSGWSIEMEEHTPDGRHVPVYLQDDPMVVLATDYDALAASHDALIQIHETLRAEANRLDMRIATLEAHLRRADGIEDDISAEDWYKQRDALLATSERQGDHHG